MARRHLIEYACYTNPDYMRAPHLEYVAAELEAFEAAILRGEHPLLIIAFPPQHGKCIAAGTQVLLANGKRVAIEDIRPSDMVISLDSRHRTCVHRITAVSENGVKPVLRITLQSGRVLVCTHNHRLLTIDGWREAGMLRIGEHVATVRRLPIPDGKPLPFGFAALMGYLTGDGSYSEGEVRITAAEKEVVEHLEQIAAAHGWVVRHGNNYSHRIVKPSRKNSRGGNSAIERMREYMTPAKSRDKRVPKCIFTSNRDDLRAFLGAYFNCDATVTDKREGVVEFYSTSEMLLRDVQHLLTRFGIFSTLRVKRGRYMGKEHLSWRLIVSGGDMLKLAEEIPALGERGRKLRAVAKAMRTKWRNPEHDAIPNGWQKYLKHTTSWHRFNTGIRIDKRYKYGTDRRVVRQAAEAERNEKLLALCSDDVIWDRVVNIEDDGEQETYDLQVDGAQNFVANDFVVHNSQLVSIHFVEWLIGRHPKWSIIETSATKDLPDTFSRAIRNTIRSNAYYKVLFPHIKLSNDSTARSKWMLEGMARPTVRAAGVGGQIVGNPAVVLIIDDPIKNYEDAQSEALREKQWRWWTTGARTRVAQRGGAVMMLTRWHESDLAGRWIEQAQKGGDRVRVVRLPALCESQARRDDVNRMYGLPPGLPDPLGRREGEALWREMYDEEYLLQTRAVDADAFETLYQGNPVPFGSAILPRDKFKLIPYAPPEITHWCRGWDLAFKDRQKNDFTSGARVALGPDGSLYISRMIRYKREWPESRERIITTGQIEHDTDIAVESVAAQVLAWQELVRDPRLANRRIIEVTVDGDKRTRAMVWAWRNLYLVAEDPDLHADWIQPFLAQASSFPYGKNDDDIDAVSIGVSGIALGMGGKKTVSSPAVVTPREAVLKASRKSTALRSRLGG